MPGVAAGGASFESIVKGLTKLCTVVGEPLRPEVALKDTDIGSENRGRVSTLVLFWEPGVAGRQVPRGV